MSWSMASRRSQSSRSRWMAARDWRLRSGRGRKSATSRLPAVGALLPFGPHQEAVGQHDQDRVAVEAVPPPSLILVPAQQGLGILVKPFDLMPAMGVLHQLSQRRVWWEVAPVPARVTSLASGRDFAN